MANISYIARLVHVGEEPGDGHVADGLLEEHLLYGGRVDGAQRRQQQEQLAEATGLSRVPAEQHHRRGKDEEKHTNRPLSPSPRAASPINAHLRQTCCQLKTAAPACARLQDTTACSLPH